MGRHSLDPARSAPTAPQRREPIPPVTDPVLLDAVQRDLRSLRMHEQATGTAAATRRVETPFSGPVDVPLQNVIGPHRPAGRLVPPAAPHRSEPGADASTAAPALSGPPAAMPRPVAARTASSPRTGTGAVIVPTHRPVPVPVEAPRDLDDDHDVERQGPLGLSARTLLLSTGIGLLAATALSLLTLIPR